MPGGFVCCLHLWVNLIILMTTLGHQCWTGTMTSSSHYVKNNRRLTWKGVTLLVCVSCALYVIFYVKYKGLYKNTPQMISRYLAPSRTRTRTAHARTAHTTTDIFRRTSRLLSFAFTHGSAGLAGAVSTDTSYTSEIYSDHNNLTGITSAAPSRILYNKVPKCGSTTLTRLFKAVAKLNNVTFRNINVFKGQIVGPIAEKMFVKVVYSLPPPTIVTRHILLPNFTAYGRDFPVMINLIRDPVDRVISEYYYKLSYAKAFHIRPSSYRTMSLDRCISHIGENCITSYELIAFFCGQAALCRVASVASLQQAKNNVQQHYAVVGILEEMSTFISLLEAMFPSYFTGLEEAYSARASSLHSHTTTSKRREPNNRTRDKLREYLKYEYEFYDFIKQRFHQQVQQYLET